MTIQNPVTWTDLCAEFGLVPTAAVFPRDFYGKGGAPATGVLGFQDFVGRSNAPTFNPEPDAYDKSTQLNGASFGVTSSVAVTWSWTISGSGITANQAPGVGTTVSFAAAKASNGQVNITATYGGQTYNWSVVFGNIAGPGG